MPGGDARAMRILVVTDAWHPQINGVVRTLQRLSEVLPPLGATLEFLTPEGFASIPMPSYSAIPLALATYRQVANRIAKAAPDHVHIATEGPLGIQARRVCIATRRLFTTSYHTRFPEYLSARFPIPEGWTYGLLRGFHNAGCGTLVATPSMAAELTQRGFSQVLCWTRGVDTDFYRPDRQHTLDLPRPIFLSVGRVAVEKNLPAFLDLSLPGSKVVVGEGPDLASLSERYPDAVFLGTRTGGELADIYASADVFVFPSRTDTFGNVILEALASGVPVAAFPVTGPRDILGDGIGGVVSRDLGEAALAALRISPDDARAKAMTYSWPDCAALFLRQVLVARARASL